MSIKESEFVGFIEFKSKFLPLNFRCGGLTLSIFSTLKNSLSLEIVKVLFKTKGGF